MAEDYQKLDTQTELMFREIVDFISASERLAKRYKAGVNRSPVGAKVKVRISYEHQPPVLGYKVGKTSVRIVGGNEVMLFQGKDYIREPNACRVAVEATKRIVQDIHQEYIDEPARRAISELESINLRQPRAPSQ
jgi:hypothetical protein